jgi:hypothetical protein
MFGPRRRCPKCGWNDVRYSEYYSIWENLLRLFFLVPFRCRICRHRFFRFPNYIQPL